MRSVLISLLICICPVATNLNAQDNWPQFRGVGAAGVSTGSPPTTWNIESGKNVKWRSEIEGLGHSSPTVWGDRIFLTTATNTETDEPTLQTGWLGGTGKAVEEQGDWKWQVICLDMKEGKIVWSQDVAEGKPAIKRHLKASHANCSVATDGEHVVAFFGSEGLFCFDFEGNKLWEKHFGRLHSGPYNAKELEWGFASSPVIHGDRVVVQCDCLNTGFVAVLDIDSGDEVLRIDREDVATWSTPTVVESDRGTQIVCNGYKQMAGYDFETGQLLWTLNGGGDVPVPSPLFANGLIYLTNGHGRSPIFAISPDATGDLTPLAIKPGKSKETSSKESAKENDPSDENAGQKTDSPNELPTELPEGLVWWQSKDGSYMPTPIIVGELMYVCNDNGRLSVRNALTGESIYRKRVGEESGTFSASAVATQEHLYFSSESGLVIVIKTGDQYELVAENSMDGIVMATPAIAGDRLLIRTTRHLICLEETDR